MSRHWPFGALAWFTYCGVFIAAGASEHGLRRRLFHATLVVVAAACCAVYFLRRDLYCVYTYILDIYSRLIRAMQ